MATNNNILNYLAGANAGQYGDLQNQTGLVGNKFNNIMQSAGALQQQEKLNDMAYGSAINSMRNKLSQQKLQNQYSVYSKGQTGGLFNMVMAQTNQQYASQSTDLAVQNTIKQIGIDAQKSQLLNQLDYLQEPTT